MKKRVLALLMTLAIVLSLLPGTVLAEGSGWDGVAIKEPTRVDEIYQIGTAEELAWFAKHVNETKTCSDSATLTNHINLNDKQWTPIGTQTTVAEQYKGTFDGQLYTISGLKIEVAKVNQGLFGVINGASIKNLNVKGTVNCGINNNIGGIVGKMQAGSIENCTFEGSVTGGYVGGIVGYLGNVASIVPTIQNCTNSGTISGTYAGGMTGYAKYSTISNCYNTGSIKGSTRSGGIAGQLQNNCIASYCYNLGTISSSQTAADICDFLYSTATLDYCFYKEKAIGNSGTVKDTCAKITSPEVLLEKLGSAWVADTTNMNAGYPVLAWQTDKETVVVPVTSVSIDGEARSGKNLTAQAKGAEDLAATGVQYQWQVRDRVDGTFTTIVGATGQGFAITTEYIGKYISVSVAGDKDSSGSSKVGPVLMSEADAVVADKASLGGLPESIRSNTVLSLPSVGVNGSQITWESGDSTIITKAGVVTQPETKNQKVSLTATLKCGGATETKTFNILIYSEDAVAGEASDPSIYLENAVASLELFHLRPTYGTDTNVKDVLKAALTKRGYGDLVVSVKSLENPTSQCASISDSGGITYYYSDPNTLGSRPVTSIPVTFTLAKGSASVDYKINAGIDWNQDQVKAYLDKEIFSAISIANVAAENFDLPKYIGGKGGKTWVKLVYAVSDESALTISTEKQSGSVDAQIYGPYVGKIKTLPTDRLVTLTVTAEFNYSDPSINFSKTYPITIKGDPKAAEALRQELLTKLNKGFTSPGLTDYVTRLPLDTEHVVNDIQFPTTRDFGVDGKYYPVTISSSDENVIAVPKVNNAARVTVYRPLPSQEAKKVTLTVSITDKASGISATKAFDVVVLPLEQKALDAEIALMDQVKKHYFDGIRQDNASEDAITSNLHAFQEAYLNGNTLTWVYDSKNLVNHGIKPVAMENWADLEQWRTFRSSNAAVISHENLLVTRQVESKAVTITSYLSSEIYGKYAQKYPNSLDFQKLYYQPVSAKLIVTGTAPTSAKPIEEKLSASLTLQSSNQTLISKITVANLSEGTTVFDIFAKVMRDSNYRYSARGSYVYAITNPNGTKLEELDEGANSGWMFKVNGVIPSVYMAACPIKNGDNIVVFFTKDYTEERGYPTSTGSWNAQPPQPSQSIKTEMKPNADGTYSFIVTVDGKEVGAVPDGVMVSIPNVQQGKILVIVNADGTETVVKKSFVKNGTAYLLLKKSARIKVVDEKSDFSDVSPEAWHSDAVNYVVSRHIFEGTSKDNFSPDGAMTRGMLAVVLHRLEDEPVSSASSFRDITANTWYADAVNWASHNGITNGYSDGSFAPDQNVSRQQLVVMLYRYANADILKYKKDLSAYQDAKLIDDYAQSAMAWAVDTGLLKGRTDGTLSPSALVTRAEVAVILERMLELMIKR